MNKIGAVIIIIVLVTLAELFLLVVMPIVVDLASTANTTIAASGANVTAMPGAQSGLLAAPWILYFVIPVIGIVIIILMLRKR